MYLKQCTSETLNEIIQGCKNTGGLPVKAINIYYWRIREYNGLGNIDHITDDEYAMSFVRDYIYFKDENRFV